MRASPPFPLETFSTLEDAVPLYSMRKFNANDAGVEMHSCIDRWNSLVRMKRF
ncbi:hypothetical protein IE4771_PA00175 (plasmid) [Rhizobium etli bv. mimosae str. IE4771]|uniref:Uncharacterized protein n=1 Tax=Rhizobium etli bv. mimosae str. IE4771 TaxID=1432050 RepID=A0A060ID98_RHIET|nr:hypothetical protein IE4771_PA00175 [Rhizobium sp. IE4771]